MLAYELAPKQVLDLIKSHQAIFNDDQASIKA
jgi:hypothetical protein